MKKFIAKQDQNDIKPGLEVEAFRFDGTFTSVRQELDSETQSKLKMLISVSENTNSPFGAGTIRFNNGYQDFIINNGDYFIKGAKGIYFAQSNSKFNNYFELTSSQEV